MDIKYYLAWICLIHLFIFAGILWSNKTNRKANRVLALFMLCLANVHICHILILSHKLTQVHFINEFGMISIFFVGPLYIQYVSYLTGIKINWKKYLYLHLIPLMPVLVWAIGFFFKTSSEINTYYEDALIKQPLDATIITSIATIQMGFYVIWSVRFLNRYTSQQKNEPRLLDLKWLKTLTIVLLIATFIISPLLIILGNDDASAVYIYYPLMTILIYATIFYKSINLPNSEVEKKQIREQEREKISRDIHDDLGSGLSKISFITNSLKVQLQHDKKSMQQIDKISKTSQDLASNMSHLIWTINPENDTTDSLLAYIREYSFDFLNDCGLECHFNFPETTVMINLLPEQRKDIFLVLKESLNNITKHASATHVWLDIFILENELNIIIKDDGKGFLNDNNQAGNGLKNMRCRMERTGGKYKIESNVGKGTNTMLTLRIK